MDEKIQDTLDVLRNNTLDVLECGDLEKVITDCAEDCINVITDSLEQFFEGNHKISTKPIDNNFAQNQNAVDDINHSQKTNQNIISGVTSKNSLLEDNGTNFYSEL